LSQTWSNLTCLTWYFLLKNNSNRASSENIIFNEKKLYEYNTNPKSWSERTWRKFLSSLEKNENNPYFFLWDFNLSHSQNKWKIFKHNISSRFFRLINWETWNFFSPTKTSESPKENVFGFIQPSYLKFNLLTWAWTFKKNIS